jgi:uncharacterized integral membrane protein
MTTEPSSRDSGPQSAESPSSDLVAPTETGTPRLTRASAVWVAVGAALLLLVMLIVFILQNPTKVEVHYLGLSGTLALGMALLIAAVGGGVVVAIAGAARVTQLRMNARRTRQRPADA